MLRKQKGLSQEELGHELSVSRQTVSKWEAGQSYPDFQRLVLLSDYFDLTLNELVRDIDVQEIRSKHFTDEKVDAIFRDLEHGKWTVKTVFNAFAILGGVFLALMLLAIFVRCAAPLLGF